MPQTRAGMTVYRWVAVACALVLVLSATFTLARASSGTTITAHFDRAVGLYVDSSVRVLGVEVGRVTAVEPGPSQVRLELSVDNDVRIPADAKAVVVAPSLVSDRYVQLTPAYEGGERMASGAEIPARRTAVPVELDELFANLEGLSTALGPNGANAGGALNGALDALAANLDGNGKNLNDTVKGLADLSETLEANKGDLFGTVRNLGSFTEMLARSDKQVRELFGRVADVTEFLAGESKQVDAALSKLATALKDVRGFVDENDELLASNVDKLTALSKILVNRRGELAEVLDVGPTGMSNFINAYDAASGSIAIRGNLNELTYPPVLTVCKIVDASTPKEVPDDLGKLCKKLAPVIDGALGLPTVSEIMQSLLKGEPPELPLPLVDAMGASGGGS